MQHSQLREEPGQPPADAAAAAGEFVKAGKFGKALRLLLPLLRQDPSDIPVLDLTATCLVQVGDSRSAAKILEMLLEHDPGLPKAWGKLAAVRATSGDIEGAAQAYRQALCLQPDDVGLLAAFNHLEPFGQDSANADFLRAAAQEDGTPKPQKIQALFALGKIEGKAGDAATAFDYFALANKLKADGYDPAFQEAKVRAQLEADWPETRGGEVPGSPRLLFVTGLPRSGTTLVETCLTQHPDVASIGESEALSKTAAAVRRHAAAMHGDTGWWNWLGRLEPEELQQFRRLFWQCAFGQARPQAPVVIDKMPLNCFEMGLAHLLLPNARFLFLSRHPLDTGLSNFTTNFAAGNRFSCQLDWIGHMTRCVYRSARDYQAKLGEAMRVQSYEALVTAPEEQIRGMLTHAGLSWDKGCLSPEKNARSVRTASLMQVRESINTGALGKWQRYEAQLAPLKAALGGDEWIAQWQHWDRHAAETGRFAPDPR
ncbi:tetratricopeptide repeat-containing sulfotransferase family protein [Leisingera thetidis]|uniref:tetratricopeptide repeat-containing sulfotransferase family protein n=1 Tax=Leisingera thetidis TaxID=2930199 RepID=UPI0021F758D6|nr:tetratricopeptide repeat-containing sulfotransferase family protein [Leisingera thetidis]